VRVVRFYTMLAACLYDMPAVHFYPKYLKKSKNVIKQPFFLFLDKKYSLCLHCFSMQKYQEKTFVLKLNTTELGFIKKTSSSYFAIKNKKT